MKKSLSVLLLVLCAMVCACRTPEGGVVNKVLSDFGLADRPEGYVSGADKIQARMGEVGQTELKRLNAEHRNGEVKFEDEQGLSGKYYKETKVYEEAYPVDVQSVSQVGQSDRAYVGYIDYAYRIHQSERRSTRTEAAALDATVPTDKRGRDKFRYYFSSTGSWDGAEGEPAKR